MLQQNTKYSKVLFYLVFAAVVYFPVFHHLERQPINLWDESLFSLRALHLAQTGEYLDNFNLYQDLPDHRNTKLPFTTYLQTLSLKIFGVNEFAIRLPISLLFIGTVILVLIHIQRRFNVGRLGAVFGLVAITAIGFVEPHFLRTGDQDAPFACYLLLCCIWYLDYLETKKTKYLIGFTAMAIAALLTKNLLAGLIAPGILLFTFWKGKLFSMLKDYKFLLSCVSILGVYAAVIAYFESRFPGFIDRMWNYELMGRYTNTIENHSKDFLYFFTDLALESFVPYFLLIPIIFASSFNKSMSKPLQDSIQLITLVMFCYTLVLSFSQTKTDWYIAPNYLFGSYVITLGSIVLYKYITHVSEQSRRLLYIGIGVSWTLLYITVMRNVHNPQPIHKDEKYGLFMKKLAKENPGIKQYTIVDNNFGTTASFYKEMYNSKDIDYAIGYQRHFALNNDQLIMSCLNNVLNPVNKLYQTETVRHWDDCKLLKIISKNDEQNTPQD